MKPKEKCRLFFISVFLIGAGAFAAPNCENLLTGKSLSDVAREIHGGNPLLPTPGSRLGQYLAQSGAAPFVHRFANGQGGQGPEKLVVPVSAESFPLFEQLFGATFPNVFEHLHTPRQGTLMVRWMGNVGTYGQMPDPNVWRFPQVGSIGPMVLLSDSEARRLGCFFRLVTTNNAWRMPNQVPGLNYPADNYIGNCTAWVGHLPVGDNTVTQVTVPGNMDGPQNTWGPPRTGALTDYDVNTIPNLTPEQRELMKQVWSSPGHQPLFEVLGVPLTLANHTNPGWVALTLTGIVGNDRVPFVILYTQDHRHPPQPFDPMINPVGP